MHNSASLGLPPRCSFASVKRCPRYYQSLSLLGTAGSTSINPEEDERLLHYWKHSDLWPRTREYATGISGSADESGNIPRPMFSNFCPEVAYDRFGYFATLLASHADEIDGDLASEFCARENLPHGHWRWHWASVKAEHYSECPLYSPLFHGGAFSEEGGPEFKIGFLGISMNFRSSWTELRRFIAELPRKLKSLLTRRG